MHKVWFTVHNQDECYHLILELKTWFGNDWRGQRGIRKKFKRTEWLMEPQQVWFLVPDLAFKTFIDLKMSNNPKLR